MEKYCSVKEVAGIMRCSTDTARRRMEGMPGAINAGTEGRRQLLVPERNVEDWMRNRKVNTRPEIVCLPKIGKPKAGRNGKMARINRRTGKLEAV